MFDPLIKDWNHAFYKSNHKVRNRWFLGMSVAIALLSLGAWLMWFFGAAWLGLEASNQGENVRTVRIATNPKTLWDVLELVIVPASLLAFGYLLSRRQDERADREAEQRMKNDREIAADQAEDAAMQAYFDAIAELLIPHHGTSSEQKGKHMWELARSRTLTILVRLNGRRKGYVLRFLTELGLLGTEDKAPLIDLSGAYLHDVDLSEFNLPKTSFAYVSLAGAHLKRANMKDATFTNADLTGSKLMGARLDRTNLAGAQLNEAILLRASLVKADLSGANLDNAVLRNVDMTDAVLDGASMKEIEYDGRTSWPQGYDPDEMR